MRIYTKLEYHWDGTKYALDKADHFEYNGEVALLCGASSQQKQIEQQQQGFMGQLMSQATSVFGGASSVFQSLVNTFTPTVQAGPNQQGFSPAELAARNASAIETVGQQYKNAKAAVGNVEAAQGGGNVALPSGVNVATDVGLATGAAGETARQLNQIQQENYAVGRENYQNAVKGLAGATDVFNPATSAASAATTSGEAAANTANQITQASNSWMAPVAGILGAVGGAATGGLTNKLLNGFGNQGGSNNSNSGAPSTMVGG